MFTCICVPKKRAAVVARGCKQFSIRTEIHRLNVRRVANHSPQFALGGYLPNLDRIVRAGGCDHLRIATKDNVGDALTMSLDRSNLPARLRIPKHDLSDRLDLQVPEKIF